MTKSYCDTCKSATCTNPDHIKMDKAFTPENDGDLSKITKAMSHNLIAQLEEAESMAKALKSSAVAGLAKERQQSDFRAFAAPQRPVRHAGEAAARTVHVEAPPEMSKGMEYKECGTCGFLEKSMAPCRRCEASAGIVEATTDWRMK